MRNRLNSRIIFCSSKSITTQFAARVGLYSSHSLAMIAFLIAVSLSTDLLGQDLYFIPFSQGAQLQVAAQNAEDPTLGRRGICWAYSLGWLDQAMAQKTNVDKKTKGLFLKKDGGDARINLLRLDEGTQGFRERHTRYEGLSNEIHRLYPEYEQNAVIRMNARMALINMNAPLGNSYWRRIEPDRCREYDFSTNSRKATLKEITALLKSTTPNFIMINLKYDRGGHTVAAISEKGGVSLFDPNMGEEGNSKISEQALNDWLVRIGKTIYQTDQMPTRISVVTMSANEK
ncbi:MAG: YopT-type cysteine protease domain-containing protein [Pirellulaceae bacterium]